MIWSDLMMILVGEVGNIFINNIGEISLLQSDDIFISPIDK